MDITFKIESQWECLKAIKELQNLLKIYGDKE